MVKVLYKKIEKTFQYETEKEHIGEKKTIIKKIMSFLYSIFH